MAGCASARGCRQRSSARSGTPKTSKAAQGGKRTIMRSSWPHQGNRPSALKHAASGSQPHSSNSRRRATGAIRNARRIFLSSFNSCHTDTGEKPARLFPRLEAAKPEVFDSCKISCTHCAAPVQHRPRILPLRIIFIICGGKMRCYCAGKVSGSWAKNLLEFPPLRHRL